MPFGCPGTQRVAGATRWQVVAEVGIVEGTVRNKAEASPVGAALAVLNAW